MSLNESKDKGDEATSTIEVVLAGGISLNALAQPDARLTTTKWELAAYYLYYVGNSGLGPVSRLHACYTRPVLTLARS
jgi:hypothetical protein